ncbi:MAG TPA: pirin-like C-terminal cupin domain-containing protein [Usitatibacter sp.]|nr:pirin-like C-terminal cupin domain-containing protein [Usitatibacter sp.]
MHLIAGEWNGRKGPIESLTGVFMSTLTLKRGARVSFPGVAHRNVFLYVVNGNVRIGSESVPEFTLAELADEGDTVEIEAATDATVIFGHADPIDEAVVAHGPFVMNTGREIEEAIRDYQAGKFGPLQ